MDEVAGKAKLVDVDSLDAESRALTATISRSHIETALADDEGADLRLEIARIQNGERDDRAVSVAWERADLEQLLRNASGDQITFAFDQEELERMLDDPDVEAQGLREKVLVLTVAAATAGAFAGASQAMPADIGGTTSSAAVSGLVTDNTSGQPGAVTGFTTDASTSGVTDSAAAADAAASSPADGWMSGVESTVSDNAGINVVTDNTSGQPGAVSGFATDASTNVEPGTVSSFITDTSSERTRTPGEPAGGGGFSMPDASVDAALAAGLALLITGAAFIGRTQRRTSERPA
jgi:hypothetical protein